MQEEVFVLGINGSPHKDGIVNELLQSLLTASQSEGAIVETVNLYDLNMVPTMGNYSKDPKLETEANMIRDDIVELYPKIKEADAVVFATPVYWANMSAVMKNFIEHLTPLENDGFQLRGKIAAFIAASKENEGGVEMAAMSMVASITQMGFLVPPNAIMWHPGVWNDTKQSVSWAKEDAPIVGRNIVKLVKILKDNSIDW